MKRRDEQIAAAREICLDLVRRWSPKHKRRREFDRVRESFRQLERRKTNRGAGGDGASWRVALAEWQALEAAGRQRR